MTNEKKGQDGEDPHHLTIEEVVWTGMLYCTVLYCSVLYCTVQAGGWGLGDSVPSEGCGVTTGGQFPQFVNLFQVISITVTKLLLLLQAW